MPPPEPPEGASGVKVEWGAEDFDWRDQSLDEQLAKDWLTNDRLWRGRPTNVVPEGYDLDVDGWALELVQSDLDPERGWRLILWLVDAARDDDDLRRIAVALLETFLREHGHAFLPQIESAAVADPKFIRVLKCSYWPAGRTGEVISQLVRRG